MQQFFEMLESREMLSASIVGVIGDLRTDSGPLLAVYAAHPAGPAAANTAPTLKAAQAPAAVSRRPRLKVANNGPITITHGGTYSGTWTSYNAKIPAVRIRTSEPVIIENSTITSRGTLIDVFGYRANVTVRNSKGYGLNPNLLGRYPGRFLDVDGFTNLVAQNNYLENTSGIYLYNYLGNRSTAQTVKVIGNKCVNVDGRVSNGKGGWVYGPPNPDYYKQFFQINGVHNIVGMEVAWNQIQNNPGQSRVEENINIHNTWGSKAFPIQIHDNYIEGAYPANAGDGKTYTGGGIMTSDNGSSYVKVFNNQIVATGHIGITITSGHDNSFYNNRILSDGLLPNGKTNLNSNTGAVIWNFNSEKTFKNNTAYNNLIGWVRRGQRADWWAPNASRWVGNKAWPGKITPALEAKEFTIWQNKVANAGAVVGPMW